MHQRPVRVGEIHYEHLLEEETRTRTHVHPQEEELDSPRASTAPDVLYSPSPPRTTMAETKSPSDYARLRLPRGAVLGLLWKYHIYQQEKVMWQYHCQLLYEFLRWYSADRMNVCNGTAITMETFGSFIQHELLRKQHLSWKEMMGIQRRKQLIESYLLHGLSEGAATTEVAYADHVLPMTVRSLDEACISTMYTNALTATGETQMTHFAFQHAIQQLIRAVAPE